LALRFFVILSFSEIARVRDPEVSVKPVASKELLLLDHVSATCTVSAFDETVTVSGSEVPAAVKVSATAVVGAAGGPATAGGAVGSAGGGSIVVVQVALAPVEISTTFVAEPLVPIGLALNSIVRVRWSSVKKKLHVSVAPTRRGGSSPLHSRSPSAPLPTPGLVIWSGSRSTKLAKTDPRMGGPL
jgi:hypothetical protein